MKSRSRGMFSDRAAMKEAMEILFPWSRIGPKNITTLKTGRPSEGEDLAWNL